MESNEHRVNREKGRSPDESLNKRGSCRHKLVSKEKEKAGAVFFWERYFLKTGRFDFLALGHKVYLVRTYTKHILVGFLARQNRD